MGTLLINVYIEVPLLLPPFRSLCLVAMLSQTQVIILSAINACPASNDSTRIVIFTVPDSAIDSSKNLGHVKFVLQSFRAHLSVLKWKTIFCTAHEVFKKLYPLFNLGEHGECGLRGWYSYEI